MPTPLSVVQDELKDFIKQEIEKTKPALTNHLPIALAELAGVYAIDTEKFWEQKHDGYFPGETKLENESFETSFQKNLKQLVAIVSKNAGELDYAGPDAKNNLEVVKIAVAQNGGALYYAGDGAKNNPEVVMMAVAQNALALKYAGPDARNNPEVVKIAVAQYGRALRFAGADAKNNPGVVKIAVSEYWYALAHAGADAKNNPEVVKIAVAQYGLALAHAGDDVKNNPEVVKIAVTQCPNAIVCASLRIQENPSLLSGTSNSSGTSSSRELLNPSFCLQALISAALVGGGIALIVTAISLTAGVGLIAAGVTVGTFFACRKFNTRRAFQEAEKDENSDLADDGNLTAHPAG